VATSKAHIRYDRFARAYIADPELNGTKAAISAGYSKKTAYSKANQLLKKVEVRVLIDSMKTRRAQKLEITGEKVLREIAKVGFANMQDYFQDGRFIGMDALTADQAAAVQEYTVDEERRGTRSGRGRKAKRGTTATITRTKFKLADKLEALDKLGKHLKLFGADEHGASTAVKVIIVNSPRPNRPQPAITVQQGKPELAE
jgi:phage terminase small subunit